MGREENIGTVEKGGNEDLERASSQDLGCFPSYPQTATVVSQEPNAASPPSVPSSRQQQASVAQGPEFSGCYVYPSAHFYSGLGLLTLLYF